MSRSHSNDALLLHRRQLLGAAVGAAVGSASAAIAGVSLAAEDSAAVRRLGPGPSPLGERSPFAEQARVPAMGIVSFTPHENLEGTITPSDLHFERHHGGIPALDPQSHELLLHGMVERPLKFSLTDIKRFPSVTRSCFIECSGNYFPFAGEESPPHLICGLTSQSEWTGVALSTLLREAGVKPGASWIIAEGGDAPLLNRSIPLAKALDDVLLVYAQNGEAIRPAQGYPMRLLVPGWEGNTNVKWLRRLEITDAPVMSRQETSKYTEPMRDGTIRQFSFEVDARSIITAPSYPATIAKGWQEIRGIAWSGRGKIQGVEVSTDGGKTWQPARMQGPVLSKSHTRFTLPWFWDGEATELQSRAIDETGYVQPTLRDIMKERGPGSGPYHFNPITGWLVRRDGELRFSPTG
ncbi:sulfite dehydrogenase [gamma proteobacterium NOR5-3]|nr:sulfite dehydrogenase [gamma proteobacterium NOR5-3]